MIEKTAEKIAISIKSAGGEETASIDVLRYALIIVLNGLFVIMVSLTCGWLTDKFIETLLMLLGFVTLRLVSGGIHLHSSALCTFVSILIFVTLPHVAINEQTSIYLLGISIILALLFAPSRIEGHSRIDKKYYPVLKLISIIIIGFDFFILSPALAKAFFIQSLSLIHFKGEQ
ncbi:accessory gene regulator ArgB-like protein [Brevibacillus laterosporus]|uniref:accessory gene regulator ArgB-like protein n=1 Tax=Brevibacillus laterosporus TaxID=1465 RepID=UPI003D1B4064